MAAEIERKFLIEEEPDWLRSVEAEPIQQSYIALGPGEEVRVRLRGDDRLLTVKRGSGEVREEVTVELGAAQAERLWPLGEGRRVRKRRRVFERDGVTWEVDSFEGALEGLIVAEVEFGSERESRAFEPPGWVGRELTGEDAYSNRSLAVDGLPG